MEDRRDLDPASPARRTATAAAVPPEAGLGGPGTHGDPAQRDTESPPPRAAAAGHPDTILRWHRDIVRRRWAARSIRGKTGRPATRRNIRALVLRLAAVERRGMRRTGPISRTIAATKRYPVHLGSTRVRRTATARQPIVAGARQGEVRRAEAVSPMLETEVPAGPVVSSTGICSDSSRRGNSGVVTVFEFQLHRSGHWPSLAVLPGTKNARQGGHGRSCTQPSGGPGQSAEQGRAKVVREQVEESSLPWFAPASLEAAMSANCLLVYQFAVPDSRFPRTFSAAYRRYMSGSGPRYTTAPSPLSRASRHRLPSSLSSGR